MKLGSLFDGIGGFPHSAQQYGIMPVWASEICTNCIAITRRHFPNMQHLGDITRINGACIEPVDIITFGSPCTNLSQAGKRNGFNIHFRCWGDSEKHIECEITGNDILTEPHFEKTILANDKQKYLYEMECPECGVILKETNESALFFNAIRTIEEMRAATDGVYPRFIVWENVYGAFSSGGGEDFRTVLEEICKVANGGVSIPRPDTGKWKPAGGIVLDGDFSLAWRTLDAQYWGVAQRRRRIFLVADFRGQRAGEILFVENSHDRHITPRREARKEATAGVGDSVEKPDSGTTLMCNSSGNGIAGTLDSSYYKGTGERSGVEREYVAVIRMREGCDGGGQGSLDKREQEFDIRHR